MDNVEDDMYDANMKIKKNRAVVVLGVNIVQGVGNRGDRNERLLGVEDATASRLI